MAFAAKGDWPDTQSLPDHTRLLARQSSVRMIGGYLLAALALRLWLGQWSWADLVGPVVILALEPFTEWMIHVHLLHWRPKQFRGRTVDPLTARRHRAHHADPRDLSMVLVPAAVLKLGLPLAAVLVVGLSRFDPQAVTALTAGYAMFLAYEWTHSSSTRSTDLVGRTTGCCGAITATTTSATSTTGSA